MQDAFEYLKEKLETPPALPFPDFYSPFVVETDASSTAFGMALSQREDNRKLHPVRLASQTMTERQRRYSTNEREALAVFSALKNFPV